MFCFCKLDIVHVYCYVYVLCISSSIKLVVSNNWLAGNTVFSETAVRIFLIFCMKLGDCKGRKVTELDFLKKFMIWRYLRKGLQISPKSGTLILFLKNSSNDFFGFWPELSTKFDLQFE